MSCKTVKNTNMDLVEIMQNIIPPVDGWEPNEYYLVEVSFTKNTIIHRSLFYSGFISNGKPCAGNCLFNPTYYNIYEFHTVHYLKVIKKLPEITELMK